MNTGNRVEALILQKREIVAPDTKPNTQITYDTNLQIWVNCINRNPVVLDFMQSNKQDKLSSDFGETTGSKTSEGFDQSEVIGCSDFGETLLTETREGADQSEIIGFSDLGETTFVKAPEGSDQSEVIRCSDFGETRFTATSEGADQGEISSRTIDD